jgi:methylmalonyl-CoA mutase
MSDKSIGEVLTDLFPKSRRIDWKNIATLEIEGKNPDQSLSWYGKDEILFLPYYETEDTLLHRYLSNFQNQQPADSVSRARYWVNLPLINAGDEINANKIALDHLSGGADGILFDLKQNTNTNLHQLLADVRWDYCFVGFMVKEGQHTNALSDFIKSKFDPKAITGALFWESIPKSKMSDMYISHCPKLKSLGLIVEAASPTEEISEALVRGVKLLEQTSNTSDLQNIFQAICFSLQAENSFAETIAKLKALRMLWFQVALCYGQHDYKLSDLHLHVRCDKTASQDFRPDELVKDTFRAMAAIFGGCDSLTLTSSNDPIPRRLSRNVSHILLEESFLGNVADPLAGAYAIDAMVDAIARKGWEKFQLKWKHHHES